MNLNDLYEMRDPRDAYERDVDNSRVGMNQQSRADVTGEEEPSGVFTVVINGKPWKTGSSNEMFALAGRVANKHTDKKVAVKWPTGELNVVKPRGVAEGSQRVDSLVTDALKIMRGSEVSDAVAALKTVLGDREFNDRRGHYNFYVRQLVDMYGQQDVAEGIGDLGYEAQSLITKLRRDVEEKRLQPTRQAVLAAASELAGDLDFAPELLVQQVLGKGITESDDYSPVTSAITRRIIHQHPELLAKYGPAVVGQAIDEIAEFVGDVDEIGSSDVSGWVSQVIRSLGRFAPVRDEGVAESAENRHHFIRHNIWTVMDSDEEVMQQPIEGDPFFSAKKFMRDLDDLGYDFTHVISPDGKITYAPQHDPRHLKNFPDEGSLNEFLDPQAVAQDPGLEKEPNADLIIFGRMPQDFTANDVVEALEAILPGEYPPGQSHNTIGKPSSKAELIMQEIAKRQGAVVTTKPLSVAQKLAKTFQTYGIKCKVDPKPGLEEDIPAQDSGEYDYEGDQAKDQMNTIVRAARRLNGMLDDNENMPEWVQMKVTLAADYLDTAADYIESNQEPELDEGERGRGRPPLNQQDTTPVTPGRVEKTATGIRHHADASRYGGTEPDDDEADHLLSKAQLYRLSKATEPEVDEGEKVGNMDADKFDAALARMKKLAGAGPLKTVWDPEKRVYKNVPTAVQPKK